MNQNKMQKMVKNLLKIRIQIASYSLFSPISLFSKEITSVHDAGVTALLSMDPTIAVKGVLATNKLAIRLKEYLTPFALNHKTVTKEVSRLYIYINIFDEFI